MEIPREIFGQPVTYFAHHSDVVRLHALLRFGGAYFDSDLIPLDPMTDLLASGRAFIGAQPFGWAGNGVIGAPREAPFIARWLQQFVGFDDARRGFFGAYLPTILSWAYPEEAELLGPGAFYWPFQTVGLTITVFTARFDFLAAGNRVAHFYGGSFQVNG